MNKPHEEWLERAENDLRFAHLGLKEGFYAQVCFLSQQIIEKSLKGALIGLGRTYPKSHNLRELSKKLPEIKLDKYVETLTIIDGYYVPIRYPDAAPGMGEAGSPNEQEAQSSLNTAEQIFSMVSEFLSRI